MMNFADHIRSFPDFPKPGVLFWDFAPLLASPKAFKQAIREIKDHYQQAEITHILAIEAKGFTLGSALAYAMERPLSLLRKPGLIPGEVEKASFIKEYGVGEYHLKINSFEPNSRVLIVYDILAAAGATAAAIELVKSQGADVVGCAYVIELEYLKGRESLADYDLLSLVKISR
jgi:adenine phosphoribosyltransferase